MTGPILQARDVTVRLKARTVLDAVSVSIGRGEVVALIGPNGAGKSTLIRALAGLIDVASGSIQLDGRELTSLAADVRARALGYLPQSREVHWPLSVREVVALGRMPHAGYHPGVIDKQSIDAALSAMDVTHLAGRAATELSGGEQARVLMARALAQATDVLLADEPTAGLDLAHRLDVMQVLRDRARATGLASVVALHDLALADRFADRVILMAGGRIVAAGVADQVLTPANIAAVWGVEVSRAHVDGVPVLAVKRVIPTLRP